MIGASYSLAILSLKSIVINQSSFPLPITTFPVSVGFFTLATSTNLPTIRIPAYHSQICGLHPWGMVSRKRHCERVECLIAANEDGRNLLGRGGGTKDRV